MVDIFGDPLDPIKKMPAKDMKDMTE